MTNITFSINLEDLLHYGTGFILGISLVLWILRSIIPFGNQTAGGGGGTLSFLLLLAIIAPTLQDVLSTPTVLPVRHEPYTDKSDDDNNIVLETTTAKIDTLVNTSPSTSKADAFPDGYETRYFIQVSYSGNGKAADQLAKKYDHIVAHVVPDNGKFIVVVGEGFKTRNEAQIFKETHQSILPEDAFIVELIVE